jgi:hypothetical protein
MRAAIASVLLLGLVACKGGDDDDDDGMTGMDATVNDTGNVQDTGVTDTGVTDTGVPGACNVYDGTGCPNANEYCVYVAQQNAAMCRTLPAMNGNEMPCNQAMNDCAPGYACGNLGNGDICYKTCDLANDQQCGAVTGMSTDYVCTGFTIMNMSSIVGFCVGQDLCNPAEGAAGCPQGETCSIVSQQGETGCLPQGNAMLGMPCTPQNNCMSGGICLDVGSGSQCYAGCDPQNMCAGGFRCQGLQGFNWGVCLAMGMACDPLNMPCPAGMTCSLLTGAAECATSGSAAVGQPCNPNMQCVDGASCVFLNGQPNPVCYEPCNLQTPACSAGTCQNIGTPFGICVP